MLHAIDKGKTKFYTRYLGKRDGTEHVHEEDEITSIVLGPLDFLPALDVYRFWSQVLRSTGYAALLPTESPSDVNIALWSRRNASDDGNSIEPDGMVTMKSTDGQTSIILLLELKWRAPLSGEDQLHRQWTQFLNATERTRALHLFIAPEITAGAQAPNNEKAGGNVWEASEGGSRLVLLPWLRIRAILDDFAKENSALGRWAKLSDLFLERIGIRRFAGFHHLATPFAVPAVNSTYLFWNPHNFSGWAVCGEPPDMSPLVPSPLFFTR